MMSAARDTLAIIFLEKRLAAIRERYLDLARSGRRPGPEFLAIEEVEALEEMKRRFYSAEARTWALPPGSPSVSDEEDYGARGTAIAEGAVLRSHRIMASMPWVGAPGFEDS